MRNGWRNRIGFFDAGNRALNIGSRTQASSFGAGAAVDSTSTGRERRSALRSRGAPTRARASNHGARPVDSRRVTRPQGWMTTTLQKPATHRAWASGGYAGTQSSQPVFGAHAAATSALSESLRIATRPHSPP